MEDWKQKFKLPNRFKLQKRNKWEECIPNTVAQNHIDLWKDFPDYMPSQEYIEAITNTATNGNVMLHQYTRGCGHPRFVNVLSKLYSHLLQKHIDPMKSILVCFDIYSIISNIIVANITKGDEVIIIQPGCHLYEQLVNVAGGKCRFIPLQFKHTGNLRKSSNWVLDDEELETVFNSRTKLILISTPNFHLGKVYTKEELIKVANLCRKWNVVCVADESEEFLVYEPEKLIRFASLPEMWDRTITIGSFDSTFLLKGWKLAWAYGTPTLITNLHIIHLDVIYTCGTLVQEAVATVWEKKPGNVEDGFRDIINILKPKKEFMYESLSNIGLNPIQCDSGIFIIADVHHLEKKLKLLNYEGHKDVAQWLANKSQVEGMPLEICYEDKHGLNFKGFVRFCFNRKDDTLQSARERLYKWFALHNI